MTNTAVRSRFDPAERRIIRLLQEDGRMPTVELARRTGASEPTVRKKLARITQEGGVRVRAAVDPVELGYEACAYIGIDVERSAITRVAALLARYPFVDSVAVTTGPYDLFIKACFETLRDLYDFILVELATVEGIKDSHSFLVLQNFKTDGLLGVPGADPEPPGNLDKGNLDKGDLEKGGPDNDGRA